MNGPGDERRRERRRDEEGASADARIQAAVARIEQAARDLSASATDRAADYIEGVADRMAPGPGPAPRDERERAPSWPWSGRPRTSRLYRDRDNGKLLGVCAGIAGYYGLEPWVVRLIALTGLVFLTSVTLVGYFVAALLMDPSPMRSRRRGLHTPEPAPPAPDGRDRSSGRRRKRRAGRHRRRKDGERAADDDWPAGDSWVPRQRLRDVRAGFDQMELRLRRMETHITSGHYELHRELAELERRDAESPTNRSG